MKIALMYAMPGEIESLLHGDTVQPLETVAGVRIYQVARDVIACCGGVGKVNAAMSTQLLIQRHHPDLIISVGVAGSFAALPVGTLVLAEGFLQHDVDTTAVGDPIGLVSTVNMVDFPTADFARARAAMDKTGLAYRTGIVATGDWFAVGGDRARWIADTFHPLLCEMEGGAVAQVCYRNGVPFMALKSVSDCIFSTEDTYFNFPAAMQELNRAALCFAAHLQD
ncbi:MAG: 5'-methylthioadenosine/S-adenosylhomocysteine nucleosidase [Clostridiales bacterium]|nr:5'-methylthioadenosine/S-adenosylhomocysteine nucleosidase [Candidatus Cacconaster stercorequi]